MLSFISYLCLFVLLQFESRCDGRREREGSRKRHLVDRVKTENELHPIPLLSVSLTIDPKHYVPRLLRSIDYPVEAVIIQVGHSDEEKLKSVLRPIRRAIESLPHLNASIAKILRYNPGSSRGFNFGLHHCVTMDKPWVLIVNSDIAFYPGTLQNIANAYYNGPVKFDIGFMSLVGHWSGLIVTRRCIDTIGYFDENIYPAYYEDDDYAIRVQHAKLKPFKIPNTSALHGETNGGVIYKSGTGSLVHDESKKADPDWKKLGHQINRGVSYTIWYLSKKWGWEKSAFNVGGKHEICKYVEGMEGQCVTPFSLPFNDSSKTLAYWKLNVWALRRIVEMY